MGDAEKPELTKQFNEGYKTDLAEPGEAPGGKDEISEVKLWTPLRGGLPVGVGRADTGGNPGSVGDKFAFGNTEERARLANMGCKEQATRVPWSTGVRPHHRPRLRQVTAWPLP